MGDMMGGERSSQKGKRIIRYEAIAAQRLDPFKKMIAN